MKKKAFTLIELLIVICILGMFVWILFKTYTTISEISFKVEQEKKVNEEFLFVSQILQNFASRDDIDFERYGTWLIESSWFTDILYMSWEDWRFSVYSSWKCVNIWDEPNLDQLSSGCAIYLSGENIVKLTSDNVYFSKVKFRVIPYVSSDTYFYGDDLCKTNYFACVNNMWFWMFTDVYTKLYNSEMWSNRVKISIQQFFNI